MTEPEIIEAIEGLLAIINSGATEVTIDGQVTKFSIKDARRRLRELENQLARLQGRRMKRPIVGSIRLDRT